MAECNYDDLGYSGLSKRIFAAWYDLLNTSVEHRVVPHRKETAGLACGEVLEIGGGTGANLTFYPSDVQLTFIEPNLHMARRLRRKASNLGIPIKLIPAFGENIPIQDGTFDTVVTTLVLCMVNDVYQVLAEIRRVLKPSGRFLFYEHVVSNHEFTRFGQALLNPLWKFVTTGCNLNRDITRDIKRAGFSHVDITRFSLSVGLPVTIPNIIGVATT